MPLFILPSASQVKTLDEMIETYEKSRKVLEYTLNNIDLDNLNNNVVMVVDSGSNSNGYYRKYSDGTMECWNSFTANNISLSWSTTNVGGGTYYYTFGNWTFPAPFVAGQSVILAASGDIGGAGPETHLLFNIDNTKCQFENGIFGVDVRTTNTQTATWMARGRWK